MDKMLDSRGHEIVSSTPVELPFTGGLNKSPRMSILERIQLAMMRQRMDDAEQIRDEADALEDMRDFDVDDEPGLLPEATVYTVSDDVPDKFVASEYRQAQAQAEAKKKATATSEPVAAATDSN